MARSFDNASTQYLEHAGIPDDTAPWSFGGLFYIPTGDVGGAIMAIADTNGFRVMRLRALAGDVLQMFVSDGTGSTTTSTSTSCTYDTWHHGAIIVSSSSNRSIYLDAGGKGTSTVSRVIDSFVDLTTIGVMKRNSGVTNTPFSGYIAECYFYNVAITEAELAVLANGVSPAKIRPQNLLGYWPLIGRTSPEIDIVGGYDMTLNNTPTTADHPPIIYPGPAQVGLSAAAASANIPEFMRYYRGLRV